MSDDAYLVGYIAGAAAEREQIANNIQTQGDKLRARVTPTTPLGQRWKLQARADLLDVLARELREGAL